MKLFEVINIGHKTLTPLFSILVGAPFANKGPPTAAEILTKKSTQRKETIQIMVIMSLNEKVT